MTQTPTPRTDAEEGAIFAAFSEDRISAKQAIRAMAAESRRHEREAACRPSPVVISEMETPTPEMDAFERDIIACIPEELHQLQAYARKGRELETRLAAASEAIERLTAEIEAMRGGEALEISEGISGTWFYHLSRGPRQTHSICGARVMTTKIPLSAWGRVSHLNERYCVKCAKHIPTPGALT